MAPKRRAEPEESEENESSNADETESDSTENPERAELLALTKVKLVQMARKLGVPTAGNKEALVIAILGAREAEVCVTAKSSVGVDGWRQIVLNKTKLDIDNLQLDWSSSPILLTPSLWPVIMWRQPISRDKIFGLIGTDGELVEALRKRWRSLLDCSEEAVEQIRGRWVTMWTLTNGARADASMKPEQFVRENWILNVEPAIHQMRLLQSDRFLKKGQAKIASKIRAMAEVPHEHLGLDVVEIAVKNATRSFDGGDDRDDWRGRKNRGNQRRPYRVGHCRKCGVKATPEKGVTNKQWFEEHNIKCKHKAGQVKDE